jgi:hypothetical protein
MYLARTRVRLVVPLLAAVACSESPPTALASADLGNDLAFVVPTVAPEHLIATGMHPLDAAFRPMSNSEPLPPEPEYPDAETLEAYNAESDIWNQQTRANFIPGALSVIADHNYSGNLGRIETTGSVRYQGQVIGTQRAETEETWPFIFDFGMTHWIGHSLRVYVDRDCGLTGSGDSRHYARWQAVMGGPVFDFSPAQKTSQSEYENQGECAPTPFLPGGGIDEYSGDRVMCYFWVEYDLETGEIYDYWLMYCTGGG